MRRLELTSLLGLLGLMSVTGVTRAAEPPILTLDNVPDAKRIVVDEPIRDSFSPEQAARYLDTASLNWQKNRRCATCHTNMAYLMARPALHSALKDSGEVREFFESYFKERWMSGEKELPEGTYQPVVVAAALAFNDAQTSGKLAEITRHTLDTMWRTQRPDGGWNWLKCGWAPMEIDDHYGVTLAALATSVAPGDYAETEAAQAGLKRINAFLQNNPAPSLHHRVMVAWSAIRIGELMTPSARDATLKDVFSRQLPDGGWSTAGMLNDWQEFHRKDAKPHDVATSDAYGTGLAIVFAREMGIPAQDSRLQRGITWLKSNQRRSGEWFTRSPSKDSRHYFTNFGSAFAILALQACGDLPGWPFGGESRELVR